mmetsp:Transcript_90401/g.200790  ORF Transcript_90401/g.200790 Transcript_90401/m.200790 type:complete len:275 (-) Transcript_90401:175-999(-)
MPGSSTALLLSLAAATLVLPGNGQFLRGLVHSYSSSSFVSSSSWFPGSDGRMHKETHEMRSETVRNNEGEAVKRTKSEIACADGRCQQTVSVARPGSITVMQAGSPLEGSSNGLRRSTVSLRAFLHGLLGPRQAEQVPQPLLVSVVHSPPPPQLNQVAPLPLEDSLVPLVAIAVGAVLTSFTAVALLLKCRGIASAESARELPLRSMGEPLAPILDEVVVPLPQQAGSGTSAAAMAAKEGLARIYARASAAAFEAEARAAAAYLARVYARVGTA